MSGTEDDEINEYFISTAFPKREESEMIYDLIAGEEGANLSTIVSHVNATLSNIKKALYFMESEGYIRREKIPSPLFQKMFRRQSS